MPASRIFSFLASFFITFLFGLCVWSAFLYPDNIFGNIAWQVRSIFFRASVSGSLEFEELGLIESKENQNKQNIEQNDNDIIEENENIEEYTGIGGPDPSLMSEQDLLDDIAEKLDIIQQQVQELTKENRDPDDEQKIDEEISLKEELEKELEENNEIEIKNEIFYPKILIS
ncbi:MAG TPA: hypothetical protein DEP95_03655, partial [Candidatus Staskawiczbacteria bacterium]|nr:hypothetical protein [Candidatus Staskawiczbacteria bacterium]